MYQNNQYESIGNQFNHIYKYTHNPLQKNPSVAEGISKLFHVYFLIQGSQFFF
jgi:hypothetical protein